MERIPMICNSDIIPAMSRVDLDFFHGRPGSGKGTQIRKVQGEKPDAVVVYPGGLIRQAQDPTNRYYHVLAQYQDETNQGGIVVPPNVVGDIVISEVEAHLDEDASTILFDGFPRGLRYLDQKDRVIEAVRRRGHEVRERHIYLDVDEPTARERLRLAQRGRPDDAAIDRRMKEFRTEGTPMIDELRRRGQLIEIDGTETEVEVATRIRRRLS